MEIESVGELGTALEFDFLFDEADLLLTNQQCSEIPSNQQIETPEDISTVENGELGSSSESNNQPAADTATINNDQDESSKENNIDAVSSDLPDLPPLLNIPNMASPTCNNNTDIITITSPLMDVVEPQIDPPADLITEINGEFGASSDDDYEGEDAQVNNHPQEVNATHLVDLPLAQNDAYNSLDSSGGLADQLDDNNGEVPNLLPQLPPSFIPPLMGLPAPQPYPPSVEYADQLISTTGGSNWSNGSSNQNQMMMQSFQSSQSFNPSSAMIMNAWETTPPSLFTNPYPWAPQPFSPAPMAQERVVQPFHPERDQASSQLINNYSFNNAPACPLENVPQVVNMPLPSQNMTPLMNQLGTNNQMMQSISNNNFMANNINQHSSGLYTNSFSQNNTMAAPVGPLANQNTSPLINHHQQQQSIFVAPQLMNNPTAASANYRPSAIPSGCYWNQPNQVMAATNLMDPSQSANFIPPQATSFRAQQVPNQQPQQLNQVPQVPNMYDPKSKCSMPPGFSMPPTRPQNIPYPYQVNQAPVAANVFDSLSPNSLLPELSSNAWTTPPQLSYAYNQQLNEISPPNDAMLPGSSMPSRIQPLNNDAQLNQTQMVPNMVAPQLSNPLLPEQPLMKSAGVEQFNQVPLSTPNVYNNLNNFTMNGPTAVLSRPSDPEQPVQNQIMMSNVTESQICCSMMMPTPSIHSKTQQASDKQQQASGVPTTGADHPQHDNFELPESSSMQSRLTDEELRELMNAANKAKPVAAVPPYQNYILNSLTERERKDKNTGVAVPTQSKPSATNPKEHGTSGRPRGRSSKRREGGSSAPSKRSRREAANKQEKTSAATKTAQEIVITADSIFTNPSLISRVKNAVYDPMFEGMGLPIDPHLRMFTASNNKHN